MPLSWSCLRDHHLNVRDINNYMSKHKDLAGQDFTTKGDPEGPKYPSKINPREDPKERDNSLRTLDIEGVRWAGTD
jgi:hypothetical protein